MNRLIRMLAVGGAVALVLAGPGMAGPASAAPAGRYAAQAKLAHLTAAQAAQLQRKVDATVAKTRGTQIGINEVSIPGADILLPLPGEAKARDLNTVVKPDIDGCPYRDFCAYENADYTGVMVKMFYCEDYGLPDFTHVGRYDNNETPGTIAAFKNISKGIIGYSVPPDTPGQLINWVPIWYVQPC